MNYEKNNLEKRPDQTEYQQFLRDMVGRLALQDEVDRGSLLRAEGQYLHELAYGGMDCN